MVTAIHFESGKVVSAGQVLVELDTSVERAQLQSLEARRSLAELGAGRSRKLAEREMVSQSQVDSDDAQLKTSTADLGALKAQIDRKTVRAPFAGVLGIRRANLGQYLSAGEPLVTLESLDPIYVNFGVPQQAMTASITRPVSSGSRTRMQSTPVLRAGSSLPPGKSASPTKIISFSRPSSLAAR